MPFAHILTDWPHAAGGFTSRGPHDPSAPVSGFNLGHTAHADHAAVDRCRARALDELGLSGYRFACADQIHGTRVAVASATTLPRLEQRHGYPYYPQTDALITAERGLALMLFFADCCPLWLYSEAPLCGGVAHCGWRGTVADLAGAAVRALHESFGADPSRLRAVVGPSICADCYEVGPDVVAAVAAVLSHTATPDLPPTVSRPGDSTHLDLPALNALLLERAGLPASHIRVVNSCTRCGPVPLYSWRRDGSATGRMAALFALR